MMKQEIRRIKRTHSKTEEVEEEDSKLRKSQK